MVLRFGGKFGGSFRFSRIQAMQLLGLLAVTLLLGTSAPAWAQRGGNSRNDFPPFDQVSEGFEKVTSTIDGKRSLYTIYVDKNKNQMLAELPANFANQKYFIALTISSGEEFAGLQYGEMYVYWRRYDNRLALISPNVETRSTGDRESKSSVERLFTDQVIVDVPIVAMGPSGGPVIDMDQLLVQQASSFFGNSARSVNPRIASIAKAKAFENNVELAFETPLAGRRLQTLHYSISLIPDTTRGYKPREADQRIGYFTTAYNDLGKYTPHETWTRYVTRWHLEKADAKLKLSPPKEPIIFYIEHTTPVRYRRWVRQGVEYWNKAFEKIGLVNAIVVREQNPATGEYMDLDPEDVRYNFIRWLNNDVSTAIGPSRVHPLTGQILDADIILTDGWIRHFSEQYSDIMPKVAMEGFSPETLAWLDRHPTWDPRIRLSPPSQRDFVTRQLALQGPQAYGGHALAQTNSPLLGDDEFDGLSGRTTQMNGLCMAGTGKAFDMAILRMSLDMFLAQEADEEKEKEEDKEKKEADKAESKEEAAKEGDATKAESKDEDDKDSAEDEDKDGDDEADDGDKEKSKKEEDLENVLDGMPERFIGPLLAELVAHEVGHTLGLRHNFKSSAAYTLDEINSEEFKGKKPLAGSVMDYLPINMNLDEDSEQGDFSMIGVGPYDMWAIEYGYTFANDLKPILARVSEPGLEFATDEDTSGPDPLARRYDFGTDPLKYASSQMTLLKKNRETLTDKYVKKGDSWDKARRGYEMTLAMQTRAVSMMANWVGGSFINRDKKGDKGDRLPVTVVPAQQQRDAVQFVLENAFRDEAFDLTPELLNRMGLDKWYDAGGMSAIYEDTTWPIHDRIMGIQASTLTMLMNPTTLARVYDNEFRVAEEDDAYTLAELMETLKSEIWKELDKQVDEPTSARSPFISSLRRNLQQEHLQRLIDLCMSEAESGAASKPIRNLASMQMREISESIGKLLEKQSGMLDPYTRAHLGESKHHLDKALEASYIYNADGGGGGGIFTLLLGQEQQLRDQYQAPQQQPIVENHYYYQSAPPSEGSSTESSTVENSADR